MKTLAKMSALLITSVIIGALLIVAVYMLPVSAVQEHLRASIDVLLKEGVRNSWAAFSYTRPPRNMSGTNFSGVLKSARPYAISDGFTDAIMFSKAAYRSNNPVNDAMMIPSLGFKSDSEFGNPVESLAKSLDDSMRDKATISNYARYWHGYLVYLKPLLYVMGVPGVRVLNLILQMIIFTLITAKISRIKGTAYSLALALGVLVIDPVSTAICIQYSNVYYVMLFTLLIMLSRNDKLKENGGYCLLFMFSGILTAYLDLLTYPSTVLGMSTVLYLLLNDDMTLCRKILGMLKLGISWCAGYAGMWSGKWLISYLLTGYDTIGDALGSAGGRMSGGVYGLSLSWQWMFSHLWPVFAAVCAVMMLVVIAVYVSVRKGRTSAGEVVPLLLASLYPFAWYAVMKQHSFIHYFFTHKNLAVTVFALVCVAVKCSGHEKKS